jgi:2-polyprenyl-6-methoxyphenol hydroxylase-like FAD-dependent oxidoreductase
MSDFHVLIAGGGVGGLTLAQGLKRAGVSCAVYERDPAGAPRSGYRLTMNADGGNALRACLPADLYDLYLQTSRKTPPRGVAVVIDDQGRELTTQPHLGPPNDGERPHTAIDRRTLRHILRARLGGALHDGAQVTGFTDHGDRVEAQLADGTTVTGDVLVAADGVGSAVRRQLMPEVEIIPADVGGLGLFARSPLTPEIVAELPEILLDGFVIARDNRGGMLALGVYDPREPVAEAAARIAPAEIHARMREVVADWHPALRGLVERIDLSTLFWFPFRRLDPVPAWPSSRVTLLGDAIHAMMPTRGQGANMALRDAGILSARLAGAARGEQDLLGAVGDYEQAMRDYVYPIMDLSEDHSRFGGGGLKQGSGA